MRKKRSSNVTPDFSFLYINTFGKYTTKNKLVKWYGWESQVVKDGYNEDEVREALKTHKIYKGYIWLYADDRNK